MAKIINEDLDLEDLDDLDEEETKPLSVEEETELDDEDEDLDDLDEETVAPKVVKKVVKKAVKKVAPKKEEETLDLGEFEAIIAAEKKLKEEKKATESKPKAKKESDKKFDGPRDVIVHGKTLFTVTDENTTLEEVRQRIFDEFGLREFSKDVTVMTMSEETGIISAQRKFKSFG